MRICIRVCGYVRICIRVCSYMRNTMSSARRAWRCAFAYAVICISEYGAVRRERVLDALLQMRFTAHEGVLSVCTRDRTFEIARGVSGRDLHFVVGPYGNSSLRVLTGAGCRRARALARRQASDVSPPPPRSRCASAVACARARDRTRGARRGARGDIGRSPVALLPRAVLDRGPRCRTAAPLLGPAAACPHVPAVARKRVPAAARKRGVTGPRAPRRRIGVMRCVYQAVTRCRDGARARAHTHTHKHTHTHEHTHTPLHKQFGPAACQRRREAPLLNGSPQ